MQVKSVLTYVFITSSILLMACGGSRVQSDSGETNEFLRDGFPSLNLVREGSVMHFAGDSLFNYINGAAEMYHKYDFEEVHVARYKRDAGEITVDIYRFADADMAFGMYTTLRPDDPSSVGLGAEGFTYGPVLVFTRGPFMVNLQTYDEEVFSPSDMESLARAVDDELPGEPRKPVTFDLFPAVGRVPNTERMFAESFLGRGFLHRVYTVDYSIEESEFTLFLSRDETGTKLGQWSEAATADGADHKAGDTGAVSPIELPFDGGRGILLSEKYYGRIVAGPRSGWLAGAIGFEEAHGEAVAGWLADLPSEAQ